MNIVIEENDKKGAAIAMDGDLEAGRMTFVKSFPGMIIIDHTEVGDDYRNNGVGRKMLDAMVEKARKESFKILPLCPYAKSVFDKDPSIADVLK
ncbi:N-acetyltransferase [Robertkochia marina]|uniref:N-acetyltransferase n=1 Tax=Robertkochia marina TaxID=1227945 RepID=A0A4V3UXY3_9FLAO|nr:GNAT family N-acetyltransferase [Robertkochia marina]THD66464.1 N-acetyltransferase [Robertkochia marina]TRZ44141.1 N-acetyltransferase [Robertkochia marina]